MGSRRPKLPPADPRSLTGDSIDLSDSYVRHLLALVGSMHEDPHDAVILACSILWHYRRTPRADAVAIRREWFMVMEQIDLLLPRYPGAVGNETDGEQ